MYVYGKVPNLTITQMQKKIVKKFTSYWKLRAR